MWARFLRLPRVPFGLVAVVLYLVTLAAYGASGRDVTVVIDGKQTVVRTTKHTARGILHEGGVSIESNDVVEPSGEVLAGQPIIVKKEKTVTLRYNGIRDTVTTHARDVAGLLYECGLVGPDDASLLPLDTPLASGMTIEVARLEARTATRLVWFDRSGRVAPRPAPGLGAREVTARQLFAGSRLLSEQVIGQRVVRQPTVSRTPKRVLARIVSRGEERQAPQGASDPSGRRALRVVSTAYAPGAGAGTRTATGQRARRGIVAVDPRVIPLGTRLYIPGYGYGVAADTGGAIRGSRIDVCFDTAAEAIRWGRRTVTIYILE